MKKKDIKILLVDDEPDILEIVSYNLQNEGYQIFTANNGVDAIEKVKKVIPHLILLDVKMIVFYCKLKCKMNIMLLLYIR